MRDYRRFAFPIESAENLSVIRNYSRLESLPDIVRAALAVHSELLTAFNEGCSLVIVDHAGKTIQFDDLSKLAVGTDLKSAKNELTGKNNNVTIALSHAVATMIDQIRIQSGLTQNTQAIHLAMSTHRALLSADANGSSIFLRHPDESEIRYTPHVPLRAVMNNLPAHESLVRLKLV